MSPGATTQQVLFISNFYCTGYPILWVIFSFHGKRLLVPKGVARGISFTGVSLGLEFENCVHNCDRINPPLLNVLRNLPIIGPGNVFQVQDFPMQPLEMI